MRLPLERPIIFFPQFFGLLYMVTIVSCIINHFYFLGLLFYGGVFTGFVGFCFFFVLFFSQGAGCSFRGYIRDRSHNLKFRGWLI